MKSFKYGFLKLSAATLFVFTVYTPFCGAEIIWREDFENKDQVFARWREEKLDRSLYTGKKKSKTAEQMVPAPGVLSLSCARKVSGKQCARLDKDLLRKSGNKSHFRINITTELPPNQGGVLTIWMYDYNETMAYYSGATLNNGNPPHRRPMARLSVAGECPNFRFMGRKFKGNKETDVPRKAGWRKLQFVLGKNKTKGKIRAYVDGRFAGETKRSYENFQFLSVGCGGGLLEFWPLFFDNITLDDDPEVIELDRFRGVDLRLATDRVGNVFHEGEELKVKATLKNHGGKARKIRIFGVLNDDAEKELGKSNEATVEVPAGGEREVEMSFPAPKRKGPMYAIFKATADGETLGEAEIGLGAIVNPEKIIKDHSTILASHFPIPHLERDRFFDLGFISNRVVDLRNRGVSWAGMEPVKGEIKWNECDRIIDYCQNQKFKYPEILFCLHSCPLWASDPKLREKAGVKFHALPGDLKAWGNYVEKMAERYKGKVQAWEIWNEVNTSYHLEGSYEDYFNLLKTAYEAVKKVDPEAKVVGVTCSSVDLRYYEEIFKLGGLKYLDVLGVHPYPHGAPEKKVLGKIQALRRLMKNYGEIKPIWDTEYGFYVMGLDEENRPKIPEQVERDRALGFITHNSMSSDLDVANWAARLPVLYAANGIERIFKHWRPMRHSNGMAQYGPYALAAAVQELSGAEFIRKIDLGDDNLFAYLFKRGESYFAPMWAVEGQETVAWKLERTEYQLMDKWGNVETKTAPSKKVELLLTESPVYLKGIGPGLEPTEKNFTIKIPPPVEKPVFPLKIALRNKNSSPLRGTVSLRAPEGWKVEPTIQKVEIPAKGTFDVAFSLTATPNTCKGKWTVKSEFSSDDGRIKWLDDAKIATAIPLPCPRLKKALKFDGDLSDWTDWDKAPTIEKKEQVKFGLPSGDQTLLEAALAAGQTFWEGPEDVSLAFQTAWDDKFFYLAAKVCDDVVRNQHPKGPYLGDSLEFFLDARAPADRKANREQIKVFQLIFAPLMNDNKCAGSWIYRNGLFDIKTLNSDFCAKNDLPPDLTKIAVASKITDDGYNLEIRIPFGLFAFKKPKAGKVFGLDLAVDDQDQPGKKRESQSIWMGNKDNSNNPNLFGTVKLVEE